MTRATEAVPERVAVLEAITRYHASVILGSTEATHATVESILDALDAYRDACYAKGAADPLIAP